MRSLKIIGLDAAADRYRKFSQLAAGGPSAKTADQRVKSVNHSVDA
jgi:hypothetical protein